MMSKEVIGVALIGFLVWVYRALRPPAPKRPLISGPRIKLRDGRYLSYKEHGVPKETAKYKIVFVHGHNTNKHDAFLSSSKLVEELQVYMVSFDRQGYGESDPHPKRSIKSTTLDIEELADQLELGPKFHVVGYSMGGMLVWGCLKYIPHRLKGVGLIAPAINYWWAGLPKSLCKEAFKRVLPSMKWSLRVTHYTPWLVHLWTTQKWLPRGKSNLTRQDLEIVTKLHAEVHPKVYSTQQGEFESYCRDVIVNFGEWEFDPMDLKDPFAGSKSSSVHLWQGEEDALVPVVLQRYIVKKLSWIHYHEVQGGGHFFPYIDTMKDEILKTLLLGEN